MHTWMLKGVEAHREGGRRWVDHSVRASPSFDLNASFTNSQDKASADIQENISNKFPGVFWKELFGGLFLGHF